LIDIAFHTFSQREQVNSEETDLNKNGETGELSLLTTIKGVMIFCKIS
jgi:hypothetical protein